MSEGTSNNGAKSAYPAEQWPEARSLYEGGLSLQGVAGKLGIPYSTVRYHACQGGNIPPGDGNHIAAGGPVCSRRSAAQAWGALAPILRLVYRWGGEPDAKGMRRAVTSYAEDDMPEDFPPAGAVNLRLIATTPDQLAALAEAKGELGRDDPEGPSETECNGQGVSPSPIAPEQPSAATHGRPIPNKEAPKPPLDSQPAQAPSAGHPHGSEKPQQPQTGSSG
jgi:hypothetical protein